MRRGSEHMFDDGMLELLGVLPKEEGALVVAAIEAAAHRIATEERQVPSPDQLELAAEHKTHPMLRADAFVRLCETWINASAQTPAVAPTTQVVVHVDEACSRVQQPGGRSRIEDGPWLPLAAVHRFPGCSVPAPRTDGHHVQHRVDGGRTDLGNLVSLCRFHHRRHHEGQFRIRHACARRRRLR